MNTNGGGLSYCHPGMYGMFMLIEPCGRSAASAASPGAEAHVSLAHGNGGVLSAQASVILGGGATV